MADLDTLLATAPAGSKDASQKQAHADQVFAALDKIADSKIDVTIDAMSPDAGDVLLKYVYKGLEPPSDRTAALFKWRPSSRRNLASARSCASFPIERLCKYMNYSPASRRGESSSPGS